MLEGTGEQKENGMKTTRLGTYLETFVGQFKLGANKYNIPYFSIGFESFANNILMDYKSNFGNLQIFNDITLTAYVSVHNNRLGYGDFIMLARDNGKDLLAVRITNASDSLVSSISSLMMFNGVPVKNIFADSMSYLVVFDY